MSVLAFNRERAEAAHLHSVAATQGGDDLAEDRRDDDPAIGSSEVRIRLGQLCDEIGFRQRVPPDQQKPRRVGDRRGSSFAAQSETACVQGVSWTQPRATIARNRLNLIGRLRQSSPPLDLDVDAHASVAPRAAEPAPEAQHRLVRLDRQALAEITVAADRVRQLADRAHDFLAP
jgi:hypothetical protein